MFWVVCLVLVVAGTSKVSAPQLVAPTFAALLSGRSGKEPAGRSGDGSSGVWVARTLGAVELLVGIVALTVGGVMLHSVLSTGFPSLAKLRFTSNSAARRRFPA